jgi:hypothetical protein
MLRIITLIALMHRISYAQCNNDKVIKLSVMAPENGFRVNMIMFGTVRMSTSEPRNYLRVQRPLSIVCVLTLIHIQLTKPGKT